MEPASKTIKRKKGQNDGGKSSIMSFPKDIGDAATVIIFKKYEFGSDSKLVTGTGAGGGNAITLPLPKNMTETVNIRAQPAELGVTGGVAADVMGSSVGDIESALRSAGEKMSAQGTGESGDTRAAAVDAGNAIRYFKRAALDSVLSGAGTAMGVTSGKAVNPHTVIQFDGVDMKTHTFNWTLSPKSEAESLFLSAIINTLKRHSLPSYEGIGGGTLGATGTSTGSLSRALLTYPDIAYVYFTGINQNHWYYLKPCMVQSINVDYAPNGVSILAGGNPTTIDLTIVMVETEIHTKDDYMPGNRQSMDITTNNGSTTMKFGGGR